MRLIADNNLCEAHAQCAAVDADLFPLDDDGYIALGEGMDVPDGKDEAAQLGVNACPMQALRLE